MQNQRKRGKKTSLKGDTELFSCVTTESLWDMLLSILFPLSSNGRLHSAVLKR